MSRHELSLKLGRARNYIGRVENGIQGVDAIDLLDLGAVFGRPPVELFQEFVDAVERSATEPSRGPRAAE